MKLAIVFLIAGMSIASAGTTYSQQTLLSLEISNKTIREAFDEIESKSEFVFFYYAGAIDESRMVSISVKDQTIHKILDSLLGQTESTYTIDERQVYISRNAGAPQQEPGKAVSGIVTDIAGEPVIGANVLEKGTPNGAVTDIAGRFSLVVRPGAVLVVSYIGYISQEIQVRERNVINVSLREDTKSLDEVLVIGYGTRVKKDLTGAVAQIGSDEISKHVSMSPQFAMQGKMAGVMVSNPGSSPMARPTIRIRGVSTLGFNDPLYVIDGIPLTEGFASAGDAASQDVRSPINVLSMINANDIEAISVLKDASATAIYGVRASNGVILITTKRGSEGKPKVNLSLNYGVQNLFKRYDLVGMQEYIDMSLEAINANTAYNKEWWYTLFDKSSANYMGNSPDYSGDWLDAALVRNAAIQDYNVSVTGGGKLSNYAVGAGYTSQNDVLYKDVLDRYSFFFNSDHNFTSWLKVGESFRLVYSEVDDRVTPDFTSVSRMMPWQPLYDATRPDGLAVPGRMVDGTFQSYGYGKATIQNLLGFDRYDITKREVMRNMGSFYAEVSPFKGLKIKGTFSFDHYTNKRDWYWEATKAQYEIVTQDYSSRGNPFELRTLTNTNIVKELTVSYVNKFGKNSVDLVLNAMSQDVKWSINQQGIGQNSPITSWDQRYINEGWSSGDKTLMYNRYGSGLIGYMGRLSYNYAQKYYVDATVRRDGTSKFGPGYKWGIFPSFAGAWRISSESFLKNVAWLDDLKLRGGWGQTGNQETRDYAFLSMVNLNPKAAFGTSGEIVGDGTIYPAAALGDFPVKDMSWETVTTFSAGFDMVALNNRLNFSAEYYSRQTNGILQAIVIPWTIGALNSPVVNLAKVTNRGVEFQAEYNDRIGQVEITASANLTTVRNRVSDLYRNQPSGGDLRIESGYSMNYIYGFKTDGIFQTQAETDEYVATINDVGRSTQKAPGDVRYVDLYGAPTADDPEGALKHYEPDGKIDDYDKTYLGKTIPGYYYGFSFGASWRSFDLSLGFRGVGDVQRANGIGLSSIDGGGQVFLAKYRDRWTPSNPSNTIPRAIQSDPSGNNRLSSRFIQDAGFLRFQNFQIGYSIKADILRKAGIADLRCFLSGTNLFVITPYDDLDPENITTPTVFSLGANFSF
ncbi:MAG: TonB-dependent receptor [Tannerellaceae bacterium]|jgi:TonB-linked SusC/RagA family outer membrane protein|nr:TonB-dependent receptor [Tannerellaceae bacterium]